MVHDFKQIADEISILAAKAGQEIVKIYTAGLNDVHRKEDGSLVSEADQAAEDIIAEGLAKLTPDIPVIAEESSAAGQDPSIKEKDYVWFVDPLDGTRSFVKGGDDYTVNIGLTHKGKPLLGAVYLPVRDELYVGGVDVDPFCKLTDGEVLPLKTRVDWDESGIIAVASQFFANNAEMAAYLKALGVSEFKNFSSSLKFCMIARGEAHCYPRFGPTCEWDTAASHALLNAAGGCVFDLDTMDEMTYGHSYRAYKNPSFMAFSDRELAYKALDIYKKNC